MKAKITRGLSFADYIARDSVHFSALKHLDVSAKKYAHAIAHEQRDTTALRVGRALHSMILDAEPQGVAVYEGPVRRGKAWDKFEAEHEGEIILTAPELEKTEAMRDAVRAHPVAGPLLSEGEGEVTVEWSMMGHPCRARIDWLRPDGSMLEVKTTRKIRPDAFARDFGALFYHAQIAFYSGGLGAALHPKEAPYLPHVVVVENEAPHDVAVYRVGYDTIEAGQRKVDEWIRKLDAAKRSGQWAGVCEEVLDLRLPEWILTAGLDDVNLNGLGGDDDGDE